MIIDMHVHESLYSPCAEMRLEEAVAAARFYGLDGICITNHDSLEIQNSAGEYLRSVNFPVFIGAEISAAEGHMQRVMNRRSCSSGAYSPARGSSASYLDAASAIVIASASGRS